MRELPILMNGPMVRAVLEGRKTVTRRIVKPQPPHGHSFFGWCVSSTCAADEGKGVWSAGDLGVRLVDPHRARCPFGQPGDRLWVRETCGTGGYFKWPWAYRADGIEYPGERWTPAIHMPRRASRITLEVTGVRVERLQDITHLQAIAEGVEQIEIGSGYPCFYSAKPVSWQEIVEGDAEAYPDAARAFRDFWLNINGAGSWQANPWVWVIEFRRIEQERKAA